MNDQYAEIRAELELTKKELEIRLSQSYYHELASELTFDTRKSNKIQKFMIQTIKEDLLDVNRALLKMDINMYGICEDSGQQIPIEKLKILPTARSIDDFVFNENTKVEILFH